MPKLLTKEANMYILNKLIYSMAILSICMALIITNSDLFIGNLFARANSESDMVKIPKITFIMGRSDYLETIKRKLIFIFVTKHVNFLEEHPEHMVTLDPFSISKFEVTNEEYNECVIEGSCTHDKPEILKKNNLLPVSDISWYEAAQYCKWREMRLPTEAEWEAAARGTDGRKYPWGEETDCSFGNINGLYDEEIRTQTNVTYCYENPGAKVQIGTYEKDISFYGVYDMGGNVSEWVYDWFAYYSRGHKTNPKGPKTPIEIRKKTFKAKVVKGGSYDFHFYTALTYKRDSANPNLKSNSTGFRCARGIRDIGN